MTTLAEKTAYKRFAKEGRKDNGIKVKMKDMILLEASSGFASGMLQFAGNKEIYVDYVMFEDKATGKQYQVYAKWNGVSLYTVNEYAA